MAPRKGAKRAAPPPPATEGGQNPLLATKGRARAAGNLDALKPGDEGYGGSTEGPQGQGLRVESEKGFQLSADHKPGEMIRIFDSDPNNKSEDIVLFSGTRKQLQRVLDAGSDFLDQ